MRGLLGTLAESNARWATIRTVTKISPCNKWCFYTQFSLTVRVVRTSKILAKPTVVTSSNKETNILIKTVYITSSPGLLSPDVPLFSPQLITPPFRCRWAKSVTRSVRPHTKVTYVSTSVSLPNIMAGSTAVNINTSWTMNDLSTPTCTTLSYIIRDVAGARLTRILSKKLAKTRSSIPIIKSALSCSTSSKSAIVTYPASFASAHDNVTRSI